MDGGDQLLSGRVLHDEAGGACAQRLGRELGVGVHGQEDHLGGDRLRPEPAQRLEPAHARHGQVGHDDIGPELARGLDQPGAVGHGSDEGELIAQKARESLQDDRVVVGEQHGRAARSGPSRHRSFPSAVAERHHDTDLGPSLRLGVDARAVPRRDGRARRD